MRRHVRFLPKCPVALRPQIAPAFAALPPSLAVAIPTAQKSRQVRWRLSGVLRFQFFSAIATRPPPTASDSRKTRTNSVTRSSAGIEPHRARILQANRFTQVLERPLAMG